MKFTRRAELEAELQRVRTDVAHLEQQLKKVLEAEQHDEIEHIERYFDAVETRFKGLRDFWKELLSGTEKN